MTSAPALRSAGGDAAALSSSYDLFFRTEYGPVVAFLRKLGFADHLADESTAEALTQLYWARSKIEVGRERAWVRKVARRVATKRAVRARKESRRFVEGGLSDDGRPGPDPLASVVEQDELLDVLDALPRRQRQVMAWHLDGFTAEEIAEAMGTKVATVRSHLRHARTGLRQALAARDEVTR